MSCKFIGVLGLKNICCLKNNIKHLKQGKQKIDSFNYCNNCNENRLIASCSVNNNKLSRQRIYYNTNIKLQSVAALLHSRTFCTHVEPKDADVFGSLSYRNYEAVEMTEEEEKEEKFTENEGGIEGLTPGRYAALIKSHLEKNDLLSAVNVLDLIKENRDKPTTYIYNLLLRAFAVQGNLKKCVTLFNEMRQYNLKPNSATITCLFNVCAESNSTNAMEYLLKYRQYARTNGITLNTIHYNALIKAYGWHNHLSDAFQVADEMRDNKVHMDISTYNSLLHVAISDKEDGLRLALMIWHMMQARKMRPDIYGYNLLLTAVRDTQLGNLKINHPLVAKKEKTVIHLSQTGEADLLASPPTINTLLIRSGESKECSASENKDLEKTENVSDLSLTNKSLNDIFLKNRLLLFGGFKGILNRMSADKVTPTAKTMTLLMETLPNTLSAENAFLAHMRSLNIKPDIDFYNMLIKRRSMRRDYISAKAVLNEIQTDNLHPNIMTFGVLAFGCLKRKDGWELLNAMGNIGYIPNIVIINTLLGNACAGLKFDYALDMLNYIYTNRMQPDKKTCTNIDVLIRKMTNLLSRRQKDYNTRFTNLNKEFTNFKMEYLRWEEKMEKRKERERIRKEKME